MAISTDGAMVANRNLGGFIIRSPTRQEEMREEDRILPHTDMAMSRQKLNLPKASSTTTRLQLRGDLVKAEDGDIISYLVE